MKINDLVEVNPYYGVFPEVSIIGRIDGFENGIFRKDEIVYVSALPEYHFLVRENPITVLGDRISLIKDNLESKNMVFSALIQCVGKEECELLEIPPGVGIAEIRFMSRGGSNPFNFNADEYSKRSPLRNYLKKIGKDGEIFAFSKESAISV